ncbi:hypothetical protein CC79DRAFT_1210479 [Sarocladium strictum]
MITTTQVRTRRVSTTLKGSKEATPIPDIKTLRDAIPEKCFERSMLHSFTYVVRDLVIIGSLFYAAALLSQMDAPLSVKIPLWTVYGFVQGLFFTGVWILAHECGHDSFSSNLTVNAITGWFLHCALLVPFFSWKFTHARHHRFHNHMERDTVFVPSRKHEHEEKVKTKTGVIAKLIDHTAADTPIVTFGSLLFHQLIGWPAYILVNAGAGVKSLVRSDRTESPASKQLHLNPYADVFTSGEAPLVAVSNVGIAIVFAVLFYVAQFLGGWNTALLYGLPYLWMNHWIVAITYLHHTHPEAKHYEADEWTFIKGAASTIDRDFGFIGRHIFHGIIEYHVVHHMFPRIPFYHAEEATWAIAPILGERYIQQKTNFFGDLWTAFTECKFVEKSENGSGLVWGKPKKA